MANLTSPWRCRGGIFEPTSSPVGDSCFENSTQKSESANAKKEQGTFLRCHNGLLVPLQAYQDVFLNSPERKWNVITDGLSSASSRRRERSCLPQAAILGPHSLGRGRQSRERQQSAPPSGFYLRNPPQPG